MTTATQPRPRGLNRPLDGKAALVTDSSYITGQIWSVNGGLDM